MSKVCVSLWGKPTMCLVTGASQGIGRTVAIQFATNMAAESTLVLVARSLQGLEQTKDLVFSANPEINVILESEDLSKPQLDHYVSLMKRCTSGKSYDSYMLVHNAGSEGSGKLASEMSNLDEWQQYMNLNLYSMTMLTNAFLSETKKIPTADQVVINITSLCALQPFSGLGYYCISKAAREMYLRVLALENPHLRVLSYSPGPVDTSMIGRVIESLQVDETKQMFTSMRDKSTLLSPTQTIGKLVKVLEENSFTSGERLDYFDLP